VAAGSALHEASNILRSIVFVLALGAAAHAHAVPGCYRGHIVEVANDSFDGAAMTSIAAANGITDHFWAASLAAYQSCQVHAGWSDPSFGVPGAGQVGCLLCASAELLSGNGRHLGRGVALRCKTCFPPMAVKPMRDVELRSERCSGRRVGLQSRGADPQVPDR
jgi:hypothetical protein